jgi:hypothetical protein
MAMKDAKTANDYVSVLGQKVGKALTISDNSPITSTLVWSPCVWRRAMMQHQKKHLLWAK